MRRKLVDKEWKNLNYNNNPSLIDLENKKIYIKKENVKYVV